MRPVAMGGFRKNNNMSTENSTGKNPKNKRLKKTRKHLKQYKMPIFKQNQVPG